MRAIREALLIANNLKFPKVEIQSDSETVIHAIHGNNEVLSADYPLVQDCRELFNLNTWDVSATYQPRERNRLVDALASLDYLADEPVKLLDEPPEEVKRIFIEDRINAARYVI